MALSLCVLLPTSRYEWVRDVAPGADPAAFEDGGSNRTLVLGILLAAAITLELLAVATARNKRERTFAVVFASAVAIAALFRFVA